MLRIGCCGWNRIGLTIPKEERNGVSLLTAYARIFECVEINSSFYHYHKETTYRKWREAAGPPFHFTIKAHKDITHVHRMVLNKQVLESIERMAEACRAVRAEAIVLQTPATFSYSRESIALMRDLFENLTIPGVRLAWETRGASWETENARSDLAKLLSECGVTHVVDIFRQKPAHLEDFCYFRLHGLGKKMYDYKYSDEDLHRLAELCSSYADQPGYIFFNNYEMYDDARRFLAIFRGRPGR